MIASFSLDIIGCRGRIRNLILASLLMFVSPSMIYGQEKSIELYPNTAEGAKALLQEFLKQGADWAGLTKRLQPTEKDYESVFKSEMSKKMLEMYSKPWKAGAIVIKPNPGQTELLLGSATSEELQRWVGNAKEQFPGGYEKIGPFVADGFTFYRFKFVKANERLGMAYDGLVYVNGHWRIFPKPYRVFDESSTAFPVK